MITDDIMQVDSGKLERILSKRAEIGAKVKALIDSDGYAILLAVFKNFIHDVKETNEYASLEDFKADRKALKIVEGLFNELEGIVNDAHIAADQLDKLIKSDDLTPSLLSLDGEGEDDEGRES